MRALIIEDDLLMALDYEMILSELSIDQISRENKFASALNHIRTNRPDFIILDLHLSETDSGLDLLSEINKQFIPCVIITGYPKEEFYEKARNHKVNAFFTKPINKLTLKFEIQKIIDGIRAVRDQEAFIQIKEKKNIIRIPFGDITHIVTKGNYSTVYTQNSKYFIRRSLSNILGTLDEGIFKQVHRSTIVNLQKIKRTNFVLSELELLDGTIVKLGYNYLENLKNYLDKN